MKAVTAILLAALVVVLLSIAYDLHRVARALEPAGALAADTLTIGAPRHETKEQRVQRVERELKEWRDESEATIEASRRLDKSRR